MPNEPYKKLIEQIRDVGRLQAVEQLLDWDQETYMPPSGAVVRAELASVVAGLAHERLVSDETGSLLEAAKAAPDDFVAQTNLRETRRSFARATRIPTALVKEIAYASSLAKVAWIAAREASDFTKFSPHLTKLIDQKRQVAEHVGYETEPYDALMDEYEPGAVAADIEALFAQLRTATVSLLERLLGAPDQPDASILSRSYPVDRQEALSRKMAETLGFSYEAGRADVTVHPFCTTIGGSSDVRITTRYQEHFLSSGLFGTMHETGHALYEQGLLAEHTFTPMGEAVSLGIHESQSRMWENMVGRGREFWDFHYAPLQEMFPEALGDVTLDSFYRAINQVSPSLIRVEADELTYNLHIILRFEIERAIINGSFDVADIPDAWSEKTKQSFGITPTNHADGCLQDIHWSMGAFGYFATYALGNLYAAQFFEQAAQDVPDLPLHIAGNDHKPLLLWLRAKIHQHGRRFTAAELVQRVTGKPLSIGPFVDYMTNKFERVYNL